MEKEYYVGILHYIEWKQIVCNISTLSFYCYVPRYFICIKLYCIAFFLKSSMLLCSMISFLVSHYSFLNVVLFPVSVGLIHCP